MGDLLQETEPEGIGSKIEFEGDLNIEGPSGSWTLTGRRNSVRVAIPSLLAGWRLARDGRTLSQSQRALALLGAEMTVWHRGAMVSRMGQKISGNIWGRLAGLSGTELKPWAALGALLPRKLSRHQNSPADRI